MGRREAILSRRKALAPRTLMARRENYRKLARMEQDARAGTTDLHLNSPPEMSQLYDTPYEREMRPGCFSPGSTCSRRSLRVG